MTPFHPEAVLGELGALAGRFALHHVDRCESTNAALPTLAAEDDNRLHVLVADEQTAGRGRRGRQWQSWPGKSLLFSVLRRFHGNASVLPGLSLTAGIAVARALTSFDVSGVQLKWPNDVLINGRKLAGILVELSSTRNHPFTAVIGIGINLALPGDIQQTQPMTDLATELGRPVDRNKLLARLLTELHAALNAHAQQGFAALQPFWRQYDAFANLPVSINGENETASGTCEGVDHDGALLLRTEAGSRRILCGEVSLRALA